MMQALFPYKLHLHIFQLDEYDVKKFTSWIATHFLKRRIENKKKLVWTQKAKALYYLAYLLAFATVCILTFLFKTVGLAVGLLLSTQPYIFLILAYFMLLPYEWNKRNALKRQTANRIAALKQLQVIGITGSYGKTSVKEFLYTILKHDFSVLKTPESYNTALGIAKVVDLELDASYDFFICEMGAYRRGEIRELTEMTNPRYGILTGINQQHIETFGSQENIVSGKFELIESIPSHGFAVVNRDNQFIRDNYEKYNKRIIPYGFTDKNNTVVDIRYTDSGAEFSLVLNGKSHKAKTHLLGNSTIVNILGAAVMAHELGMKPASIIEAIKNITAVPHRLEIKETTYATIIDDAYNGNVSGFTEAVRLLKHFDGRPKILITPGIVELGDRTEKIHKELGKEAEEICDYIILVGTSKRTTALAEGIQNKEKTIFVPSIQVMWKEIAKLGLQKPVILLENDLPDNY
jgi:UDP-N-acetylmuramoyl-tripeptide--D-alanyl-D-alanine ligase